MTKFSRSRLAVAALLLQAALAGAATLGAGIDKAGFDPAVRPQDDLFEAVNGTWMKNTPIPADKPEWGPFIALRDRSDERVRALAEDLSSHEGGTADERKIAAFWRSYMDEAAIDKAGLAPLAPWFSRIDALKTPQDLARELGRLQGLADLPVPLDTGADDKDPAHNVLQTWQAGLGLPDRDYYLKADERFTKAVDAYMRYLQVLLQVAGDEDPAAHAKEVYAFEKRLAEAQWSRVDTQDPQKVYNPMTPAELAKAAPGFDWQAMFDAAALPPLKKVIVGQPSYANAFARLAGEVPMATWQRYLRVRLMDSNAYVLPKAVREARFAFRGPALNGLTQDQPRWQRGTQALNAALGEAVGRLYVAKHFPPAYKARMQQLVGNLLEAYRRSIGTLTWLSPQTRDRAKAKLAKYGTKIGYPEVWRDYAKLEIAQGDALGNALRAGRFEFERRAARAGGPVDRREWEMTPQTVNAYYSANFNEVVFPAAILEPPYFDMQADDAANYGAIGAIIGHEISHGFDDDGSQYDGDGRLHDWWTPADRKAFDALTSRLVAQFDAYQPISGHHVNGKLTLGENIADLSGLEIAYKAYHLALKGRKPPVIDGMSGDQRFFYGFAQAWREKTREERALQLLTIDPHSPSQFRANGAVVNQDAFHATFHTKPGDGMYKPRDQRIRIW